MLWTIPIRLFLFIIIMLMGSWTFQNNPIVMRCSLWNDVCESTSILYIIGFLLLLPMFFPTFIYLFFIYIFLDIFALCLSAVAKVWVSVCLWASTWNIIFLFVLFCLFILSIPTKTLPFSDNFFFIFYLLKGKLLPVGGFSLVQGNMGSWMSQTFFFFSF